jgi:hypothetical protein
LKIDNPRPLDRGLDYKRKIRTYVLFNVFGMEMDLAGPKQKISCPSCFDEQLIFDPSKLSYGTKGG